MKIDVCFFFWFRLGLYWGVEWSQFRFLQFFQLFVQRDSLNLRGGEIRQSFQRRKKKVFSLGIQRFYVWGDFCCYKLVVFVVFNLFVLKYKVFIQFICMRIFFSLNFVFQLYVGSYLCYKKYVVGMLVIKKVLL